MIGGWFRRRLIIAGVASSGSMGGRTALAEEPAKLEEIPGSPLKRVVLTEKAAERLAIATEPVREEPVARWMMANGEVEAAKAGLTVPAAGGRRRRPGPRAGAAPGRPGRRGRAGHPGPVASARTRKAPEQGQAHATPGSAFVLPRRR